MWRWCLNMLRTLDCCHHKHSTWSATLATLENPLVSETKGPFTNRRPSSNRKRCRPWREVKRWEVCRVNGWVHVYLIIQSSVKNLINWREVCNHVAFGSQQCSATEIVDWPTISPQRQRIGMLSLNSLWVMREQIAICRKTLELIDSYSCDCVHDVPVVLIEGGCKATCWAASHFDHLAARILDSWK